MVIASKLLEIGIIAFSFAVGFLSLYFFSDLRQEVKTQHIEELFSQCVNFVIFIWVGKIIINFSVFISDPLVVLAYPSNARVFYFATGLMIVLLTYKLIRKEIDPLPLFKSFTQLFLISSFVFEFIELVWQDNQFSFSYLLLLAVLIGLFFILQEHISLSNLLIVIVSVWSIGLFILATLQPFVTVYNYMMTPWFIGAFYLICIGSLVYYKINNRGVKSV